MAKRKVYVRDTKGRFAHTTGTGRKTTTRKKTTSVKRVARKATPKPTVKAKPKPKATPKPVGGYNKTSVRKATRGVPMTHLAMQAGLKRRNASKLLRKWKKTGVPPEVVRQLKKHSKQARGRQFP